MAKKQINKMKKRLVLSEDEIDQLLTAINAGDPEPE
jgi:flagellar motor switch protein FliM